MTDGKGNPALEAATGLAYDKIDEAHVMENQQRAESPSGALDREGNVVPVYPEPKTASYERFLGTMGNPARWSGR